MDGQEFRRGRRYRSGILCAMGEAPTLPCLRRLALECATAFAVLVAALTNIWPRGRDLTTMVLGDEPRGPRGNALFRGVFVTVLTPFTRDGSVDERGLQAELLYLKRSGVHGLLLMGSMGEGPYLTAEQRETVLRVTQRVIGNDLPLVVGVTAPSTRQAVAQAEQAARYGADGLTVALPVYYSVELAALKQHLLTVARRSGLPVLFYYYPDAYRGVLKPKQIAELLREPEIIGVKESILDMAHIERQMLLLRDPSKVFWAGTTLAMPEVMELGGDGAASVVGLLMPRTTVELYEAVRRGDRVAVERLRAKLFRALPLLQRNAPSPLVAHAGFLAALRGQVALTLGAESTHARLKAALRYRGVPIEPLVASPLPALTPAEEQLVARTMRELIALEPTEESDHE